MSLSDPHIITQFLVLVEMLCLSHHKITLCSDQIMLDQKDEYIEDDLELIIKLTNHQFIVLPIHHMIALKNPFKLDSKEFHK